MLATAPNATRLRDLDSRLRQREAEDRAMHTGERLDLRELGVETMRRGFFGFTVVRGLQLPYAATFTDFNGGIVVGETTFSEYATPDAALAALLSQSRAK